VEIDRLTVKALIGALATALLVAGCGVQNALDGRDAKIIELKYALLEQQGVRAAELNYAERQVGIYRGCTFLFNMCSETTAEVGQALIKKGFAGDSSIWWWGPVIGKLAALAGFLGALIWVPWHLFVKFTKPAKSELNAAKKFISGLNEKVNDANRKRTQIQQETSAMRRELKDMSLAITEQRKMLSETEEAVELARAALTTVKSEIAEISRLRESFKRF
jgi:hypothetical protein